MVVYYFGPVATNTHAAALEVFGSEATFEPCATITQVFDAVAASVGARGVVPIENSTEGVVRETVDCLIERTPVIELEFELDIQHDLLAAPGVPLDAIETVLSHPQALAQCRRWLERHLPRVTRQLAPSTSAAAATARERTDAAAIASPLAGSHYGLASLASDIGDHSDNATRFVAIALESPVRTGHDRTTLVFTTPHERGALRSALGIFDDASVNLTRIESRPLPAKRWEYAFVVDLEGHQTDPALSQAIAELEKRGMLRKVLGSYPKAS
jgi:chorismate mutase / prephenate dehydratase